MNKPGLAFLVLLLVAGCKTAPATKTPSPTPAGQAAQVTQTQAVSHAAKAVEPPATQAQTSATLKQAEKGSPHTGAAQNTQAQATPTPLPQNAVPPQETPIQAEPAKYTVPAGAQLPGDSPVFEEEDLISTSGRLLNPYAYQQPDISAKTGAPWDGEQLKYGLYYSFVKAGTAYIRNRGLVDIGGRPAYLIQTTAFSASVIDAFFKVRDINQSWLDAQTFYSRGYGQSVREGNYKRDEWVIFDPANRRYYGQIQKKEAPREISGPLEADVTDFLTALYYVRAQKLEPGKDIVFDIINREKQYPLIVKVHGRERVKTPAGNFNCIKVEPQLRGEGIFVAKGKSLTVWLTDDAYRMPVKMKTEVFIGSVSATLLEYKRM